MLGVAWQKRPGPHGKGTRLHLLMGFSVADISQGSTLTWGNSHLHNLRCSSCNGDLGFGIERSSLFEQWVLAPDCFLQVYWAEKITPFAL